MSMFNAINVSATALTAEKTRIDVISKNMANANTTRATGGMPYRREMVLFKEKKPTSFSNYLSDASKKYLNEGVSVNGIVEDTTPFKLVYDPGHPDANEDGYVQMPNVEMVKEMVDMIDAYRAYEANVTAINTSKTLLTKALDIGRR